MKRLVFLLLALTACPYSKKVHESARLDGPIEAKVVHVDAKELTVDVLGHGHVGIIVPARKQSHYCELRVSRPKRLSLQVDAGCAKDDKPYLLASDPEGKRLAYAPADASAWSVLYFGGRDRSFEGTFHPPKGAIDWSKVPTLEQALPDLFAVQMLTGDDRAKREALDVVLEEIASRGDAELARVVEATIDAPTDGQDTKSGRPWDQVWSGAYDRLKGEPRDRVTRALERRLFEGALGGTTANGVARAALHLDVDALLPRWSGTLGERVAARTARDWSSEYAIGVLLARLAKASPAVAAPIGCAVVARSLPDESTSASHVAARLDLVTALQAIAAGSLDCAATRDLDRLYEAKYTTKSPDGFSRGYCLMEGWFCPSPGSLTTPAVRCTKDAARERVASRLGRTLDEQRKLEGTVVVFHEALAASLLVGGLDPKRAKLIERQTYARGFDESTLRCSALEDDAGPKARCLPDVFTLDDPAMCEPGAVATVGYAGVVVHYDDKKREVFYTSARRLFVDASADAR